MVVDIVVNAVIITIDSVCFDWRCDDACWNANIIIRCILGVAMRCCLCAFLCINECLFSENQWWNICLEHDMFLFEWIDRRFCDCLIRFVCCHLVVNLLKDVLGRVNCLEELIDVALVMIAAVHVCGVVSCTDCGCHFCGCGCVPGDGIDSLVFLWKDWFCEQRRNTKNKNTKTRSSKHDQSDYKRISFHQNLMPLWKEHKKLTRLMMMMIDLEIYICIYIYTVVYVASADHKLIRSKLILMRIPSMNTGCCLKP